MPPEIRAVGIEGLPEVRAGDDLAAQIMDAAVAQGTAIDDGDVLVVTQKIISKSEGRVVDLRTVTPSPFATSWAERVDRDPRLVELELRESRAVVRMDEARGILITETHHGFVCANSGIDTSNVPGDEMVALLPVDSDKSARGIREDIRGRAAGAEVAVVVSDTFGRAWREGHVNFAIGCAGINPIKDYKGTPDAHGMILKVTAIAVADELAAASELVTAKAIGVPVAIIRGYDYDTAPDGVGTLIRESSRDLFR